MRISFVTSAFNESQNVEELYNRCRQTVDGFGDTTQALGRAEFELVIADNCSQDDTRSLIRRLAKENSDIVGIFNKKNYGPESSLLNALRISLERGPQFTVVLCSDLQDPPEVCQPVLEILCGDERIDGILFQKKNEWEGSLIGGFRRLYYALLRYSSRLSIVPNGYHGFGCYRQEVIREAIDIWETTDLNLRQCLVNACSNSLTISYHQEKRTRGESSYGGLGYLREAARALVSGDASTSRLALLIGVIGIGASVMVGSLIVFNTLSGSSAYTGGAPTIMCLLVAGFSIQMLMNALLSRQIESIRTRFKPTVRFSVVDS